MCWSVTMARRFLAVSYDLLPRRVHICALGNLVGHSLLVPKRIVVSGDESLYRLTSSHHKGSPFAATKQSNFSTWNSAGGVSQASTKDRVTARQFAVLCMRMEN